MNWRMAAALIALSIAPARAMDDSEPTAIHLVRPGDTIPRICWLYKVRTSAILAANPGAGDPLTPGQRLVIPLGPAPSQPADPPPVQAAIPVETPAPAIALPVPASTPPPPTPSANIQGSFLSAARSLAAQRIRYEGRWTPPGEREPWVMDCSNTSRYLYRAVAGIDIGRTASDQYYFLRQRNRAWDVRPPSIEFLKRHLQPGDLLFWENTYRPVRDPDITHVMIFLGADEDGRWQMAGSQEADGVSIYRFDPLAPKGGYSSWFGLVHHQGRFVAYGRPLDSNLAQTQ